MHTLPSQLFWSSAEGVHHSIHPSESCVLHLGHTGLKHHQNNVVFQHQFYCSLPPTPSHHCGHSCCKNYWNVQTLGSTALGSQGLCSTSSLGTQDYFLGLTPRRLVMNRLRCRSDGITAEAAHSYHGYFLFVYKDKFPYRKQPGMDRERGNSQHVLLQTWSDES